MENQSRDRSRTSQQTERSTVLVVDDDIRLLDLLVRLLIRAGFKVLSASVGHEAILVARQSDHPVDLVPINFLMSGTNGGRRKHKSIAHVSLLVESIPPGL